MKTVVLLLALSIFHRGEGCLKVRMVAPPKCDCPEIGTIDQAGIKQDEYNYLGGRRTVDANITVSDSCEVTVDATASGDGDFHLFIYRSPFPPIMMKRFLPSTSSAQRIFKLDIQCASVNGVYQWEYEGSKISSEPIDLALLDYKDACKCEPIDARTASRSYSNGTCDLQHMTCNDNQSFYLQNGVGIKPIVVFFKAMERLGNEFDVNSLTCVDGDKWFYNNYQFSRSSWECGNLDNIGSFETKCKCKGIGPTWYDTENTSRKRLWEVQFDPDKTMSRQTSYTGIVAHDENTCTATMQCPPGEELILVGYGMKPKFYPPGTVLTSKCVTSPMSEMEYVWWTEEYMVITASFTCLPPE